MNPYVIQSIKKESSESVVNKQRKLPKKTHNSRGIPTAEAGDSIRSYSDCKLIQDYFLYTKGSPRNYMLFTLGCATGLRISDLLSIKICDVLEEDRLTFKKSLSLSEQKTGKVTVSVDDEVWLTEACTESISLYLDSLYRNFSLDDYLFKSRKTKKDGESVLETGTAHKIIKKAQRDLHLPIVMGSHTLRKTFLTVSFHIGLRSQNLNNISTAMGICQMLARHDDVKTTMRYLKQNKRMLQAVREKVSDFLMGTSPIDVLDIDYTEML